MNDSLSKISNKGIVFQCPKNLFNIISMVQIII